MERLEDEQQALERLREVYEAMRPQEAARILADLSDEEVSRISDGHGSSHRGGYSGRVCGGPGRIGLAAVGPVGQEAAARRMVAGGGSFS